MANDRVLVAAVLAEEPGAFERLVIAYQKLVWQIVHRLTQDPATTEDISQEVFLRVHLKLKRFRFESSLATWIGRIAYHMTTRHLQKHAKQPAHPRADPDPLFETLTDDTDLETVLMREDLTQQVAAAVKTLPPLQQTYMVLYYGEDFTLPEISDICGQPVGTIKSYLHRARNQVRKVLTKMEVPT